MLHRYGSVEENYLQYLPNIINPVHVVDLFHSLDRLKDVY